MMVRIATIALATLLSFAGVSAAQKTEPWQKKALQKVKSENAVLDPKWRMPETNVLWVAMAADGTRRDGLAQYFCMLLMMAGPADEMKSVWIYDPSSYENGGTAMGMAACN